MILGITCAFEAIMLPNIKVRSLFLTISTITKISQKCISPELISINSNKMNIILGKKLLIASSLKCMLKKMIVVF